jgi:type I restriction-modification system DNA methylase subunit
VPRYAWSLDLPISILTDFEEFSVYYCLTRPFKDDKAARSRLLYLRYDQYAERWKEIENLFSRDAVLNGSLDAYIRSIPDKKGTKRVDAALLDDISKWRNDLAINIADNNKTISQKKLNFSVQAIIDRILFLRICEDRAIEPYGKLKLKAEGSGIYNGLGYLFQEADQKYNSGLFHFKEEKGRNEPPDTITMNLNIDDNLLSDLILNLYYPNSPYIFSKIPVEILGQVYEQFLGKVIRLDENHIAEVEDKPEVKKAGGVKYTPAYIVQNIVNRTLGPILKSKNHPNEVTLIYVLDPACGSGSFLLVAYQCLLDWHLDWYIKNLAPELDKKTPITSITIKKLLSIDIEELDNGISQKTKMGAKAKKAKAKLATRAADASVPIYKTPDGIWHLTIAERKRILLNNIYGVDIDRQAVEVTKLSLLLKVLEGENQRTVSDILKFLHERALPDLGNNIKCGNSLIGWDILKDNPGLTQEEIDRINPFDWETEFPEIFQRGGFSVVIGNPPYLGGREWKEEYGRQYDYFMHKFRVAEYQFDIYSLFWEMGIRLLQKNGSIGFITPNTWLNNKSSTKLRKFFLEETEIESIIDYTHISVFSHVVVLPIVTIARRKHATNHASPVNIFTVDEEDFQPIFSHSISQDLWRDDTFSIFNIAIREEDIVIREKIEGSSILLEELTQVKFGIKLYETGKGNPPQDATDAKNHIFEAYDQVDPSYRPYLEGKDVQRYGINWQDRWLRYGPNLAAPRDAFLFSGARLLIRRIVGNRLIGAYTDANYVTSQLLQIVKPKDETNSKYLLGILNSSLIAYYFRTKYNRQDKTFPEIRIYELASMPIRIIDISNPNDVAYRDRMAYLVDQMLSLNKQLQEARTPQEQTALHRQIEATDGHIDALVYELYGLTEEEIKVIKRTDQV